MQISDQINLVIAIATCLSVVGSLAVAILTFHIAKSNRLTAELMEAQIEAATRPYICVGPTVRIGTTLIQMVIENTGQSSAENLRLELLQDFYFNARQQESDNLRNCTAFAHPVISFSPRTKLVFDLGTGPAIFGNPEKCPQQFSVRASYKCGSKSYSEVTTIDLQPFQGSSVPLDPVADEIAKTAKAIEKLAAVIEKKAA